MRSTRGALPVFPPVGFPEPPPAPAVPVSEQRIFGDRPVWCPDLYDPLLRVSAVQSGNWSGPVGTTLGPQPFRNGLIVREQQAESHGYDIDVYVFA